MYYRRHQLTPKSLFTLCGYAGGHQNNLTTRLIFLPKGRKISLVVRICWKKDTWPGPNEIHFHCFTLYCNLWSIKTVHWKIIICDNDTWFDFGTGLGGSVGCAVLLETRSRGFNPRRGRQHSFVEIDHEIFSTVILSLPLIQEGQLSVSGKR